MALKKKNNKANVSPLGFDQFKLNKIHNITNCNFKVQNFERYIIKPILR